MLTLGTLIVVGLATWQAVEIYRHSSLFEDWRYILEAPEGKEPDNFVEKLFGCGWCLSVWVATILVAMAYVPLLNFLVYGLAISRIANVLHDAYRYLEEYNDQAREDRERRILQQQEHRDRMSGMIALQRKLNSSDRPRQDD